MKAWAKMILMFAFAITIGHHASAQGFDNIASEIRKGNAAGLAKYFGGNVEISIKDAQNSYSKSQGEAVLKNFFSLHSPKTFTIVHQGQSPEGAKYFIGTLSTSAGTYRTYVYAKQAQSTFIIQEIRFEPQ
jgi:Domain of unknown function (DUF4783)